METLSFTLGVLAVIDLSIVVGTFLVLKTLNITRKQAEQTQRDLQNEVERLNRSLNDIYVELHKQIIEVENNVVRHTDSRVDKLESKTFKEFASLQTHRKSY
jgi:SMC interacting uncharacterized protein involved in chromosome segregation